MEDRERQILIDKGEDPDLPPAGVSEGAIGPGLRHWVCEVDGHEDPDRTGGCIHCGADLPSELSAENYAPGYVTPCGLPEGKFIGKTDNGEQYKP